MFGLTQKTPGHDVRPKGRGTFCNGRDNGKVQKVQNCGEMVVARVPPAVGEGCAGTSSPFTTSVVPRGFAMTGQRQGCQGGPP